VSFDFGGRVAEHVEYLSDAQFAPAVTRLAETAVQEAQRLSQVFVSLNAPADVLLNEERTSRDYGRGGWMAYHAGVAAGSVGRIEDATEMFARISNGFAPPHSLLTQEACRMARLAVEPEQFRREVVSLIERHRTALRLSARSAPPF